ncbi:PepSY domain-containing protein [Bradyrhizobium septentrionale]|uniref:PepSY domain-containing protein n=2 Tax=Bradyrhizobium septentrionale TaxID=1404411 RepID=A0A973W1U1_9BRAD|nr:PepSY domain-containing protein [Bradyrhizobium septentrionale]UGY14387.1 PepSY domain-containing protein [Bradyrhizobium septentrionale]
MLSAIVLLHRWLGFAFALLFAMWFATGMVMHFVPFPSLKEADRFAGLSPIDAKNLIGPADAIKAAGVADVLRVRLVQRSDGPVYIVSGRSAARSVNAIDAKDAAIVSPDAARAVVDRYARNRGMTAPSLSVSLNDYDQWSVPNGFDRYRPLFRVALGNADGDELYVAWNTGEVVLVTNSRERLWNYAGSVLHWSYPTVLRRNWAAWDWVVWTASFLASIAALLGAILGIARLKRRQGHLTTPYRGWHALHHVVGLAAAVFLLTWIVSGWLSMDHGRLFSRGQLTDAEAAVAVTGVDIAGLASSIWPPVSPGAREVEWFAFGGQQFRRDRVALDKQMLVRSGVAASDPTGLLGADDVTGLMSRLAPGCGAPGAVPADDAYEAASQLPSAPVYRTICGDVWFDVDSVNGMVLQRLDSSRRAYRWAYQALHTLDFPVLVQHPATRTLIVVGLCTLGFLFSITGILIGWRRLLLSLSRS